MYKIFKWVCLFLSNMLILIRPVAGSIVPSSIYDHLQLIPKDKNNMCIRYKNEDWNVEQITSDKESLNSFSSSSNFKWPTKNIPTVKSMSTSILSSSHHSAHPPKQIKIDFSDTRRKSFLPASLLTENQGINKASIYNAKAIQVVEDDDEDIFLYLDDSQLENKQLERFCTGSKYLGSWNKIGIAGKGIYKYPHGVIYDGTFNRNGEFHGAGILVYPNGEKIEGIWKNGRLGTHTNFVTKAGVSMNKDYCVMPDRRFQIELENDLGPTGQEFLTDEKPPPRSLPKGCYDLVEGYFNPKLKTVYAYTKKPNKKLGINNSMGQVFTKQKSMASIMGLNNKHEPIEKIPDIDDINNKNNKLPDGGSDTNLNGLLMDDKNKLLNTEKILWIPSTNQEEWIINNCRKDRDDPAGYRPDLYEEWTKGASSDNDHKLISDLFTVQSKAMLKTLKLIDRLLTGDKAPDSGFVKFTKIFKDEHETKILNTFRKYYLGHPSVDPDYSSHPGSNCFSEYFPSFSEENKR